VSKLARKIYKKDDKNFLKKIKTIAKRFKGKGGGPESESAVTANKFDLQDGFVWFWSDNSDITNLISRSSAYIIEVYDCQYTVGIKMDRKGFRSCCHAFKVSRKRKGTLNG